MAKTILIADDEPSVVKILGIRLKANGYQVIAAHDGEQTIKLAQQEKPDLIILDIKMPGKDGYTVFKELKENLETNSIPVLFFSAFQPDKAQEQTSLLGADGFISKSSDPDEMMSKIKDVLS